MEQQNGRRKTNPYSFRNLALWQRAQELALSVIRLTEAVPTAQAAKTITRQVVASSGSAAANIAEGHGRFSIAAYRNHLSIARGSVAETDSSLDLLQRAVYVDPARAEDLHQQCLVLLGGLTRQMKGLDEKLRSAKGKSVREDSPEYSGGQYPDELMLDG